MSGCLMQTAAMSIFTLFFLQQWYSNIGAKFISLQSDAGDCTPVPLEVTGK
jgi:hypothetical protein